MHRGLTLVVLLLTGFAAWIHIRTWPAKLQFPGAVDSAEAVALAEMVHLSKGIPVYAAPASGRFDTANYGPLYYLLGAALLDPQEPQYLPLRVVSLLGLLGCAAGSAFLAFLLIRSYLAAVLAPLLFLAFGYVTRLGISGRCDLFALCISFAGFLLAYRLRASRALLWATPLFVVAIFYKQQFVAAPLSVGLFLLLEQRYRLAAAFAGLLIAGGLGTLILCQFVIFQGQSFGEHFVTYNFQPFSWTQALFGALLFSMVVLPPLLGAVALLHRRSDRLLACYLGSVIVITLTGVAREGTDINYFLECSLIASPLLAVWLAERCSWKHSHEVLVAFLLLGIVLCSGYLFTSHGARPGDTALDRAAQEYIRHRFPPQTTALAWYPGDLVRAGLETPITNVFHYTWLVRRGFFSEEELPARIHNHAFGVIVLNADLRNPIQNQWADSYLTGLARNAVLDNYRLVSILEMPFAAKGRPEERLYIWVPRLRPSANASLEH